MRKIRGLYLDDYRSPKGKLLYKFEALNIEGIIEWVIVRNYEDFVYHILTEGLPDIISFDHDLAEEHVEAFFRNCGVPTDQMSIDYDAYKEKTGYHAARWLCDFCEKEGLDLPLCTVHSANPAGSDNILSVINSYLKHKGVTKWHSFKTIW